MRSGVLKRCPFPVSQCLISLDNAIAVFRDQRIQQVPVEIQCHGLPSRNPMNWIIGTIYPLFLMNIHSLLSITLMVYPKCHVWMDNIWIRISVSTYDTARAEVPILQGALHRRDFGCLAPNGTQFGTNLQWVHSPNWSSNCLRLTYD